MIFIYVGIGGGLGALARLLLGQVVAQWLGPGLLWGTYIANVVGSTVLGAVNARSVRPRLSPNLDVLLTVGVCGGFTTFSTFSYETLTLIDNGRYSLAILYAVGSVLSCMTGVLIGSRLVRRIETPTADTEMP
jgi:fluoride exporter